METEPANARRKEVRDIQGPGSQNKSRCIRGSEERGKQMCSGFGEMCGRPCSVRSRSQAGEKKVHVFFVNAGGSSVKGGRALSSFLPASRRRNFIPRAYG